jgi:hypothetical protein
MAIRSEDLYLSIPNASPLFSKLAISTQFKVSLDLVRRSQVGDNVGLLEHLTNCGLFNQSRSSSQTYDFLCSSASLPGSNFNISEEMGSRQGMTERFASRRIYNEFDLTFYIDSDYNSLRMLEEWMNFINPVYNESNGRYDGAEGSQLNAYQERNTYSRFRYPDDYRRKISITKFERDFLENPNDRNNTFKNMPLLTYHFIDTFPVNINAVPMSYDGSTFLQVTAVFTYLRHTIEKHGNAQQSVREALLNRQLIQVNPLRPRTVGSEITPSTNSPIPDVPVGYVSGKPYYGPFHEHMGVKMVGAEHSPYPHAIIYDTIGESLPGSTVSGPTVTETNPQQEQQEQQQEQDNQQQQQQEDNNQQQQEEQDTTPPAAPTNLSITTGQADNTPTVTGNAEANSTVKLFSQSTLLGSTTTNAGGSFSVTVSSPLSDGTYTFTLTATDAANNVSNSSGITFIINTNAGGGGGGYYGGY